MCIYIIHKHRLQLIQKPTIKNNNIFYSVIKNNSHTIIIWDSWWGKSRDLISQT